MITKSDRNTLAEAGITDIESLAATAAAFLRAHPIYPAEPVTNALSPQEEDFLRLGGAVGVGTYNAHQAARNVAVIAGEFAQMVATALSQKAVAALLGVSTSRIRQKLESGMLYAVQGPGGRVCPRFQFGQSGTLPGLEGVLRAISPQAHPVAIQRFFLSEHPDLESEELGRALSPRDWLLSGHPNEPVIELASEI